VSLSLLSFCFAVVLAVAFASAIAFASAAAFASVVGWGFRPDKKAAP
jgi:hypothetical protein